MTILFPGMTYETLSTIVDILAIATVGLGFWWIRLQLRWNRTVDWIVEDHHDLFDDFKKLL